METPTECELRTPRVPESSRCAYDPNNLSPEDEEARKYDDTSDGIDWDEIIATTQDDFEAARFSYNSADYATQAEADAAFDAWFDGLLRRAEQNLASVPACNAPRL